MLFKYMGVTNLPHGGVMGPIPGIKKSAGEFQLHPNPHTNFYFS